MKELQDEVMPSNLDKLTMEDAQTLTEFYFELDRYTKTIDDNNLVFWSRFSEDEKQLSGVIAERLQGLKSKLLPYLITAFGYYHKENKGFYDLYKSELVLCKKELETEMQAFVKFLNSQLTKRKPTESEPKVSTVNVSAKILKAVKIDGK